MPIPAWLEAARDHWRWRGAERPSFAQAPGAGQESVWDYPRPPVLVADPREVTVSIDGHEVVRTRRALRVLETSHPPSFYLPWSDTDRDRLTLGAGESFCEWKGPARYWDLVGGGRRVAGAAWDYPKPLAGAEALADRIAFYPALAECFVDGERVRAQPGGFYGGWITSELVGPFKGDPGSAAW